MGRNICHGSDSVESANNEIALWCVVLSVFFYVDVAPPIFEKN